MSAPLAALLAAVRKACLPGPWSQGVKLARDGAVFGGDRKGDTITARVRATGQVVAPSVTLYPEDAEWSCDCGSPVDPCAHVAAAVIALSQGTPASAEPDRAPSSAAPPAKATRAAAHVRYRFARQHGALTMTRFAVRPDGTQELVKTSLTAPAARALVEGTLQPTHEDLAVDRIVGSRQPGYFPADRVADIFGALSTAPDVRLDDELVKTSSETLKPRAVVRDQDDGIVLIIDRDPRVTDVVVAGIARLGNTLHPLGEIDLSGPRLERLPLRRRFSRADVSKLVSEVLPGLEKRISVEIATKRLPRAGGGLKPRIHLDLSQKEHTLSVTASLVYGDPPEARVENNQLVILGQRVPTRDESMERELLARLRAELHLVPGRCVDFDGGDAIRFAVKLQSWKGGGAETAERELFGKGQLVPRFMIEDDRFDIAFDLETDDEAAPSRHADPIAVMRAFQDGLPLVPLMEGGWAPLPRAWLDQHGTRVAELLAARREDGKIETAAISVLADLCDELDLPRPASFARLAPLLSGEGRIPEAPLPGDLTAELRPYQRQGVSWLSFLRDAGLGAVLADDMGLGKTLQTLCALRGRTLVVCPRSVVYNWAAEIQRFRPSLRASTYHGPKRALDPGADVTLTTYAILRLDAEVLAKEHWDVVVLDEAQAIKNPDSQVARAAYAIDASFRVALSGTPVENRLDELWSQLHFTNRGLLGARSAFDERFAKPISNGTPDAAAKLRRKIRPFVLRRLKKDVAPELPPRVEAVLYCELEEQERAVYDAVRAATQKEIVAQLAKGASVLVALEALLRLRQAACHSALVPGQFATTSAKIERLVEALEDAAADGHKALVFSQWTSLLDLVEPHLQRAGVGFCRLDGSTRDRAAVVTEFQSESGPPAMLISLKAGGTGLNLTAADHVFLMDPWWNPAVEDQAADRAHRIGQDKSVMVYRLVAKDTVEEGILALQERKRALADAALGEAAGAAAITREDLLALLG